MRKEKKGDFLLLALWGTVIFLYFVIGRVIPMESRHLVWCRWDDSVPFVPAFSVPYVAWFFLQAFTAWHCFRKERPVFRRFVGYILFGYAVAIAAFVMYPSAIDFRPVVTGQDVFSRLVAVLYQMDSPTNVLPSLHVIVAVGIAFALCKTKAFGKPILCILWWLIALSICASTVLIKQHSVLDILGAIPVCVGGYVLFFTQNSKIIDITEKTC